MARNDDTVLIDVLIKTGNALETLVANFNHQTNREDKMVNEFRVRPQVQMGERTSSNPINNLPISYEVHNLGEERLIFF